MQTTASEPIEGAEAVVLYLSYIFYVLQRFLFKILFREFGICLCLEFTFVDDESFVRTTTY